MDDKSREVLIEILEENINVEIPKERDLVSITPEFYPRVILIFDFGGRHQIEIKYPDTDDKDEMRNIMINNLTHFTQKEIIKVTALLKAFVTFSNEYLKMSIIHQILIGIILECANDVIQTNNNWIIELKEKRKRWRKEYNYVGEEYVSMREFVNSFKDEVEEVKKNDKKEEAE